MREVDSKEITILYHNQLENFSSLENNKTMKFLIERKNLIILLESLLSNDILKFLNLEVPYTENDVITYVSFDKLKEDTSINDAELAYNKDNIPFVSYGITLKNYKPKNDLIPIFSANSLDQLDTLSDKDKHQLIAQVIKSSYSKKLFSLFKENFSNCGELIVNLSNEYDNYKEVANKNGISDELFNLIFPNLNKFNIDTELRKMFVNCERLFFEDMGRGSVTDLVCSEKIIQKLLLTKSFEVADACRLDSFLLRGKIFDVNVYSSTEVKDDEAYVAYNDNDNDRLKQLPCILSIDTPFFFDTKSEDICILGELKILNKNFVKKIKFLNIN